MTYLYDLHRREVTRGLQVRSVARCVEATGDNAYRLAIARRSPATKLLKPVDELGYLLSNQV